MSKSIFFRQPLTSDASEYINNVRKLRNDMILQRNTI